LERILRTIRVKDGHIVVKESGMHSVEDYIMARYHMYWQVYYHPTVRSYEIIMEKIFHRLRDVYPVHPEMFEDLKMFIPFLTNDPSIKDHLRLDEPAALYGFTLLCQKEDAVLKDLCARVLNRKLFDYKTIKKEEDIEEINASISSKGYDPRYYVRVDRATKSPYLPYHSDDGHNIYVLDEDGNVSELSKKSVIVKSIVSGDIKEDRKVYFPK
jgi:HD superfamily phosphohydrolase